MMITLKKDLVDIFHEQANLFESQLSAFHDELDTKGIVKNDVPITGYDVQIGGRHLRQKEYDVLKKGVLSISETVSEIKENLSFTEVIVLPMALVKQLIQETSLFYIHQTTDNIYVLPRSWREKVLKRKKSIARYGNTTIRSVSLREAYPDGVIKSHGKPSKYNDRVKITLPKAPNHVHEEIIKVVNYLPKQFVSNIRIIADPKSLGVTLLLAKERRTPRRPARSLDPGIVIEIGAFCAILPKTFYHLSALEKGFLSRVRKIESRWSVEDFIQEYSNN